jgi:tetratricopeptide (TPR) repeat protein
MTYYEKSTGIRELIDPSKFPNLTARLAESLTNEGVNLWQINKLSEASEKLSRAEKLLLSIEKEKTKPADNIPVILGQVNLIWGGVVYGLCRFDEAVSRADAGLTQIEPYLKFEPTDAIATDVCLKLHGNRAIALAALQRHAESAKEWGRVAEMSPEPVSKGFRVLLAIELVKSGEPARALEQVKTLKVATDLAGDVRYNLGCVYALCATSVEKDTSVRLEQRSRLIDTYMKDAIRWLACAAEAGFFNDAAMRDRAKKDSDLAILVDRPEFLRIIEPPQTKR